MLRLLTMMTAVLGLAVLAGCDGDPDTDNGMVEVHNHTDHVVVLYYEEEVETVVGIDWIAREAYLDPWTTTTILVDTFLWDGEVTAECHGALVTYDLDFGLDGFETLWIEPEHFGDVLCYDG